MTDSVREKARAMAVEAFGEGVVSSPQPIRGREGFTVILLGRKLKVARLENGGIIPIPGSVGGVAS